MCRTAAKRATTARCLDARSAVDRQGPGRVYAPHLKRSEDGQAQRGGERVAVHGEVLGDLPSPAGALPFVRGGAWRSTAGQPGRAAGGRKERVLQRTVEHIIETFVLVPMLDVPVPQTVDQLVNVRACDRSAQDQSPGQNPGANLASRAAAGGTVGRSADCRVSFLSPAVFCRAERWHSSSQCSWFAGGLQGLP